MLQPELKQKYRETSALMTIPALEKAAENLSLRGLSEDAKYIRDLIGERKAFHESNKPLEITGDRQNRARVAQDTQPVPILSPAASNAAKHAALWVVVVGGASTFAGLVVWPALVALGSAVAAMMTAMAPILAGVAGVVFCAYLLFSGLFSEKKTVYPQSGGTVYNIYINQGDKVNVNQ